MKWLPLSVFIVIIKIFGLLPCPAVLAGEIPAEDSLKNMDAIDRNGSVLIDDTVMTMRNGFMELWLPRNRKIKLTIKLDNLSVTDVIETFDNSKTCVTTFKLE